MNLSFLKGDSQILGEHFYHFCLLNPSYVSLTMQIFDNKWFWANYTPEN